MIPENHPWPRSVGENEPLSKHQVSHISMGDLVRLLEAALEAKVGPFGGELVTPKMLSIWFIKTRVGFSWLHRYFAVPLAPWPEVIGRAASHVEGIESAHRCLRSYNGGTQRFYIFKRHQHWRHASPTEIAAQLCLYESVHM